jgi:hypothetical protein
MEKSLPLSNLQLELLKLFAMKVDDQDLRKIKALIAKYFAEKAIASADKDWEARKYTQGDIENWLQENEG